MDDNSIIDMFFARDERAINAAQEKYGSICQALAYNILENTQDAEESVNDTYLAAWNTIPPEKPSILCAFLCKITRNLSLKKLRSRSAAKRGNGTYELCLAELSECIPDRSSVEEEIGVRELAHIIDSFLRTLGKTQRAIFIRRYWYAEQIADIAQAFGFGQSKVKMMLFRTREKLLKHLEKEGVIL